MLSKRNDTEQPDEKNQNEEIPDKDDQEEENEEIFDEENQEEEGNTLIEDTKGSRRTTRIPKIYQRLQTNRESTGGNYSQKNIQFPGVLYKDSEVRIVAQMFLQIKDYTIWHITTTCCQI